MREESFDERVEFILEGVVEEGEKRERDKRRGGRLERENGGMLFLKKPTTFPTSRAG